MEWIPRLAELKKWFNATLITKKVWMNWPDKQLFLNIRCVEFIKYNVELKVLCCKLLRIGFSCHRCFKILGGYIIRNLLIWVSLGIPHSTSFKIPHLKSSNILKIKALTSIRMFGWSKISFKRLFKQTNS